MSDQAEAPLLFEIVDDHIALVRINRPAARNAVDGAVAQALSAAVRRGRPQSGRGGPGA